MARTRVDFERPKAAILWRLHKSIAELEDITFTLSQLSQVRGDYYNEEIIYVFITSQGIQTVEGWNNQYYDDLESHFSKTILRSNEKDPEWKNTSSSSSSSDDTWEPLPVNRTTPEYEAAVEAVENALETVEGNNGYAETEPEERAKVVWSVREGLRQIKEGLPSRDQVISMLVKPLNFIAEKFTGAAMGEAAKRAVRALWDWLGGMA